MKCVICKTGETYLGQAIVTLSRGNATFVVKGVPAQVCSNCGEEYVDSATTAHLLAEVNSAAKTGVQVDIREYAAT